MHARSVQLGILGSLLWLFSPEAPAQSSSSSDAESARRIRAAIASDIRPAADTARDANRKPLETLSFFGLRENMTVIELVPAGGWFTKIIAPVVKDRGKLYVALGPLDDVRALKAQHADLGAIEIVESGRDIAFGPARDGVAFATPRSG